MKIKDKSDFEKIRLQGGISLYPPKPKISVGMATCGLATGAGKVYQEIKEKIEKKNINAILSKTGCLGYCQVEPVVDVIVHGMPRLVYYQMTTDKVDRIIDFLENRKIVKEDILCKIEKEYICGDVFKKYDISIDGELNDVRLYQDVPFFAKQEKIVLRNCGFINPDKIEEYIARDGYKALYRALTETSPESVIEEVKKSGLRGRGGAGFATGVKWEICRKADVEIKYIICNADEGDPGAYMDRAVLEGDPHSVLEGMIIGGYAIGANFGYIYVRTEYPLAIERLNHAIFSAKEYGLLGEKIFNTDFSFFLEIREGSGAFICGEETSLIASIEGRPPEPRQRPPFPAQSGLWMAPTNINNVETWANVPAIITKGGAWFSKIGTKTSSGTKVFSVVGKINNTGLVEIPMGIKLQDIVYHIGGGIPDKKLFKAVQTGGPSGGVIPANLLNLPVDYETLKDVGSMMGSGGMVVMDEDTCVVDVAKFFLQFTNDESCGKCSSCREGSDALLEVLNKISEGQGTEEDIEFLQEVSLAIKDASLCGLGQTLPNPVLSTLRHFKEEYIAHIRKVCPAKVCKALIKYTILENRCNGCHLCFKNCPVFAILGEPKSVHKIDQNKCTKCGVCLEVCPPKVSAVIKYSGEKD